jgi:hypothetical protein
MIRLHPFKKKEGGEGRSPFSGQWKEKEKVFFHLFPLSPQATLLRPSFCFFPLILRFYFTMVLGRYLRISSLFFGLQITIAHFDVTSTPHIHCRFDLVEDFFFPLKLWCRIWPPFMNLKLCKRMKSQPRSHL